MAEDHVFGRGQEAASPSDGQGVVAPHRSGEIWSLQGAIYEGFAAEIACWEREPGKRTIAIVREYQDAIAIMADRLKPSPSELLSPTLRAALDEFVRWSSCARDRMDQDGKLKWKDARAVIRAAIDQAAAAETIPPPSDGEGEAQAKPTEPNAAKARGETR